MTPTVTTPRVRPALLRLGEATLGFLTALGALVALWGGFAVWVLGLVYGMMLRDYTVGYYLLLYGVCGIAASRLLYRASRRLAKRAVLDKVDALRVEAWRRAGLIDPEPELRPSS